MTGRCTRGFCPGCRDAADSAPRQATTGKAAPTLSDSLTHSGQACPDDGATFPNDEDGTWTVPARDEALRVRKGYPQSVPARVAKKGIFGGESFFNRRRGVHWRSPH